ncbi:LAQU0S01e01112g1_1 [Lachancea quebecensis]|uniref:LAQU0S01e01112g1_1 n=1 Tax=Lachancea quebecensis TaxID=1654605 RepID=A0A0P1KLH1_9SACH|nr:LAQU0S01e01112g1_1 [Lachancea quebecensis]
MSSTIDESAYVEASNGQACLAFKDEKQEARFELGVSMMVYKWDALSIAVENGWGGPESAEKRDWVTAVIVDLFKSEKIVDVTLIEETLLYAMADEFDTNVEDDSALPIAAGIVEIYKQCDAQDFSTVEKLYLEWTEKQKNKEGKRIVQVEEDPLNPDASESEEEEEDVEFEIEDSMAVDEMTENNTEPVVDEDGFELVQKKGRRRNN